MEGPFACRDDRRGAAGGGEVIDVWLLITGIGVGIVFSAPVGPVNILCIQRAFRGGFFSGLAAGLGAALADTFFAAVSAFGLTAVSGFVEGHSTALQAIDRKSTRLNSSHRYISRMPSSA
jgi:hypothetical protein